MNYILSDYIITYIDNKYINYIFPDYIIIFIDNNKYINYVIIYLQIVSHIRATLLSKIKDS